MKPCQKKRLRWGREKKQLQQYLLEISELTNEEIHKLMHTPFSKLTSKQLYKLFETKLAREFARRLRRLEQLTSN